MVNRLGFFYILSDLLFIGFIIHLITRSYPMKNLRNLRNLRDIKNV